MRTMASGKVKMVLADVDGTLTSREQVIEVEVLKVIRRAKKRGLIIGLASALPYYVLRALSFYLGIRGPLIAENGGVVEVNDKIIILGDGELVRRGLELLKENYGSLVREKSSNKCRLTDLAIERTIPLSEAKQLLNKMGLTIYDTKYAYHIVVSRIDKGVGLQVLCKELNISPRSVAAIGDSDADIGLLSAAGVGIAVANSSEKLKRVAQYVTSLPYHRGFIEAMEWLERKGFI